MLFVLGVLCFAAFANGQTQCGGNLVQPSGDVFSPGYPNEYDGNLDCMWTIPARGGSVTVEFKEFMIEDPESFLFFTQCNFDYVEIIVGDRSRGYYCGTDMPPAITATQDVHIHFVTDELISGPGFQFSYSVIHGLAGGGPCGSHLQDSYGVVTSPGYPNSYQSDADCTWTIHGSGHTISLTFTDFALEDGGFFSGCPYDFVEIYDGRTKIGTYCGTDMPPRLFTDNDVRIKFQSDGSVEEQGFRFEYSIDLPVTTATTAKPVETTTKPDGSGEGSGEDLNEDNFLF